MRKFPNLIKRIAVAGNGKIGSSIGNTLRKHQCSVRVGDVTGEGVDHVDFGNFKALRQWLSDFDVVLCATPYYLVPNVARAAAELGIAYFDLTEDRDSTNYVKSLQSDNVLVPQCGLAPGAVSIIAAELIKRFDTVKTLDIRVGALPLHPNNSIQYYLTWSTNGLVNEYCNLCESIYNGKRVEALPLEGYEKISLDGQLYEAFNTSGGIGSLCESLEGQVDKVTYKTIRYLGHHHLMKFLLDDLNLAKNRELFIKLFDQEVPQTVKDVVIVMVKAVGYRNGKLFEESYFNKIYGADGESAIQRSTVGGICGAMESWMSGKWEKTKGVVKQEEIDWKSFCNNIWGGVYAVEGW
jgi:saccharopine dehydrogenase-like NADP-dependent oxidoreductase